MTLTQQEIDIIDGYARGHTLETIARDVHSSRTTIVGITDRLTARLGIKGARQPALVDYAYRHGHRTPTRTRDLPPLPRRLAQVLDCATRGLDHRAAAVELGLRPSTVRSHRERLLEVLGAHTIAHAVALAWEAGLRGDPDPQPAQKGTTR